MSDAYASLFEHNEAGSPIPCPVAGIFNQWQTSGVGLAGPDDLMVPDAGADQLRVELAGAGVYLVVVSLTFMANRNNVVVDGAVFKNGGVLQNVRFSQKLGSMFDQTSVDAGGIVELIATDTLDLRVSTDRDNTDVLVLECSLSALVVTRAIAG